MLHKNIKKRRLELNMTQSELAEKTGYKTKGAISRIENGERDLSQSQISDFAKALNTTESELMGWSSPPLNNIHLDKIPGITVLSKARKIPILGTIACGSPIWADENFEGYFIADETIRADFALRAKGDSMIDAEIYDGDLVFMRKTPIVDSGKIAAVLLDGEEATLKKVVKTDDVYILQPCNVSYDPIVIKEDDEALILGEAVGVYHAIKE